jgi:hypothetical protein
MQQGVEEEEEAILDRVEDIPSAPCVVTREKNSPTVAHACRKRRLKWVLPQVGGWSIGLATLSL